MTREPRVVPAVVRGHLGVLALLTSRGWWKFVAVRQVLVVVLLLLVLGVTMLLGVMAMLLGVVTMLLGVMTMLLLMTMQRETVAMVRGGMLSRLWLRLRR